MKVLKDKYPKGSFKGQKTDGRYIDGFLYDNLKLLATKIVNDMTFMGVISSSTLEVGTGKSVLATQIGEIWPELMKEIHGIEIPFNMKNIVFRPEDLIERSFQVPKYSFILLDEWDDAQYWSTLGMTLRKFFRKCRQLNLFMICIIPNFFQFPLGYAISRSIFFIDVKFDDNLDRGNYDFYGFKAKKNLYIRGKKYHDYSVQQPDFQGEFFDGYGVDEAQYRRAKLEDMKKSEEAEKPQLSEEQITAQIVTKLYQNSTGITHKQIAEALGKERSTITHMINNELERQRPTVEGGGVGVNTYSREQVYHEENLDEGGEVEADPN